MHLICKLHGGQWPISHTTSLPVLAGDPTFTNQNQPQRSGLIKANSWRVQRLFAACWQFTKCYGWVTIVYHWLPLQLQLSANGLPDGLRIICNGHDLSITMDADLLTTCGLLTIDNLWLTVYLMLLISNKYHDHHLQTANYNCSFAWTVYGHCQLFIWWKLS